jgi:hypothetical protein
MGVATSAAPTIIPSTLSFVMIVLHEAAFLTEFSEHAFDPNQFSNSQSDQRDDRTTAVSEEAKRLLAKFDRH